MSERGRIKWFNNRAGWGFIGREGAPDVYLRHDQLSGKGFKVLQEGDLVEFDVVEGDQGPYAVNARRIAAKQTAGQERAS